MIEDKRSEEKKNFPHMAPKAIQVRNARVHNLKNVNVDVPLNQIVGIAGVSGSGKSSLALGYCTRRAPEDIWSLFPLIPEEE